MRRRSWFLLLILILTAILTCTGCTIDYGTTREVIKPSPTPPFIGSVYVEAARRTSWWGSSEDEEIVARSIRQGIQLLWSTARIVEFPNRADNRLKFFISSPRDGFYHDKRIMTVEIEVWKGGELVTIGGVGQKGCCVPYRDAALTPGGAWREAAWRAVYTLRGHLVRKSSPVPQQQPTTQQDQGGSCKVKNATVLLTSMESEIEGVVENALRQEASSQGIIIVRSSLNGRGRWVTPPHTVRVEGVSERLGSKLNITLTAFEQTTGRRVTGWASSESSPSRQGEISSAEHVRIAAIGAARHLVRRLCGFV